MDAMDFNPDGTIRIVVPTHAGVSPVRPLASPANLALGKPVKVSSVRQSAVNKSRLDAFLPTPWTNDGRFAVDENWGTRWHPGADVKNPWLIVDLGKDDEIGSCETTFE